MSRVLQTLVTLAWGLWFGGLVMLFLAVTSLFHTFSDREVAGAAASGVFRSFDLFRLGVAAAALIATFLWHLCGVSSRLRSLTFLFFALAVVAATCSAVLLTPRLEQLRAVQQTQSPQFRKLHGMSMGVYLAETFFVLGAGLTLPWASQASPKPLKQKSNN
jgi:hypothetical protein